MRSSPALLIVSRVFTLALTFVTAAIVARSLGPVGRGYTGAAVALAGILPVVMACALPVLTRQRATTHPDGDRMLRTARLVGYISMLPAATGGWLFGHLVMVGISDAALVWLVLLTGSCGLYAHALASQSVLIAQGRYLAVAVIQGLQIFVAFLGVILLSLTGTVTVAGVLACQFSGIVGTWLFGAITVRPKNVRRAPLGGAVRSAARYYPSQLLDVGSLRLDQVVVLPVIGPEQAGFHSIAIAVGTPLLAVGHAVGTAAFRHVAAAQADREELTRSLVRGALVLTLLLALLSAAAMPLMLPLVFGSQFSQAVLPAVLVTFAAPALTANYVAGQCFAAAQQAGRMTFVSASVISVVLVGVLLAGPIWGAAGTASAFLLGQWSGTAVAFRAIRTPGGSGSGIVRDVRLVLSVLRRS